MRDPTAVTWRRCFAAATGLFITGIVLAVAIFVAGDVSKLPSGCPHPIPSGHDCVQYRSTAYLMRDSVFVWFAVAVIVLVVALMIVPHRVAGTSLGRAIFGIRVVRADGSAPGFLRSMIRIAAWLIDALTLLLPVGLWLAIVTRGHRRVGDYLAGTYVIERSAVGRPMRPPPRHVGRRA